MLAGWWGSDGYDLWLALFGGLGLSSRLFRFVGLWNGLDRFGLCVEMDTGFWVYSREKSGLSFVGFSYVVGFIDFLDCVCVVVVLDSCSCGVWCRLSTLRGLLCVNLMACCCWVVVRFVRGIFRGTVLVFACLRACKLCLVLVGFPSSLKRWFEFWCFVLGGCRLLGLGLRGLDGLFIGFLF